MFQNKTKRKQKEETNMQVLETFPKSYVSLNDVAASETDFIVSRNLSRIFTVTCILPLSSMTMKILVMRINSSRNG